jgi:hypothetical protein
VLAVVLALIEGMGSVPHWVQVQPWSSRAAKSPTPLLTPLLPLQRSDLAEWGGKISSDDLKKFDSSKNCRSIFYIRVVYRNAEAK